MRISAINFISPKFNSCAHLPPSVRAMRAIAIAGIAISVCALIVATSIGRGFETRYRDALLDFNAHVVVMGMGEVDNSDEISDRLAAVPEKVGTTPFIYREALSIGGGRIAGVVIKGIDPETIAQVNSMPIKLFGASNLSDALSWDGKGAMPVIAGLAFLKDMEISEGAPGISVKLLIPGEKKKIKRESEFTLVRIVGSFESGMHDYDAQFLLMALPNVRKLFDMPPSSVTGMELKLADPEKAQSVAERIEQDMGPRFSAIAWSELNRDLLAAVRLEKFVSALIMGIMVVVAALNIVSVLTLMTLNRLHEISVLKAIGLSNRGVCSLLFRGGVGIGAWGVLMGAGAGILIAWAIGRFDLVPLEAEIYLIGALPIDISPLICGMIIFLCFGAGLTTSVFASRRLAKIPAAEGLQIAR